MFGRVAAVAEKIPEDRDAVAWNHAHGVPFHNVRWGDWPLNVCDAALKAAALSELDYAAVDVMVEEGTGTPWIIEINSAGSLPRNEDRSPSYRARCVAKCLGYHLVSENYDHFPLPAYASSGWRDVIHPAIWSNHPANSVVFTSCRT